MRKLLLSVLLCAALVMGLLPTAAFPMELGNTPEAVEKAPTSALEEQTVNEELLSEYGEQKNAPKAADPAAQNDAAEIYVSSTGNDEQNTGTKDLPFATLAKAVDAAADGTTIYVMSDLTMDQCARFYDKSLKITSGEGGPYTIKRSADFKQQSDTARSWYNPAMIEVQSSSASSVGLTLSNIVLDDAGMHEGTVFAQAVSGDGNGDNTVYVQDAIIASNATVPCTVTLGKDAVLRNFGGMSAVRATDQAKIVMESGSVIEDTLTGYTRTKGSGADSVGPAGAIWLQGGTLVMEEGSKIRNMDGRGVYADGGKVEIGGAFSSIAANKSAMWQANSGIVIHLRNNAEGTLTSTALIEKISSGSIIYCAGGAKSFKMENGSKITDCPKLNGNVIYAKNCTVVIDGEISNVYATGNHILQTDGGTAVTIGENGRILNNHAYYGAVYINGTDEHLDIYGKINGNICANRGGGVVLSNNGGNHNATMYEGAEICNNKAEQTGGGAMISKGVFTMNGGTISGNISGTNSAKGEADRIGGGVFVRRGGQFIMNGGAIENNATTAFGGGVCFDASDYGGTVPKIELNAGTIRNNLMQVTVGDEYQITGGISNDLAVTGKDYGKCDRYLYISREAAVGDKAVYFQTGSKTVTPDDSSLDIRLGNTSAANVTALTDASKSMGWNDPLTTLWVQRDGAAELTIGGLTLNNLPVYVLSLPVDETGKVLDASEVQVYEAQKTDTGDIDITLPDVSGNGHAVAIVQPSQNHGTLIINGPETIERNKTGADYPVTYTVTYDMSESMESIIEQSGGEVEYVLTIDQDVRLTGNPGSFNGESIQVTYSLPHSEFKAGDFLLASAKLRITVGQLDYIIPSNVTKTQKIETTYSLTTQVNGGNGTISASKAGLAAGSHETIVFTPDSGYEIDTVTVNGVKAEVLSNTLEVIMDADKTVIVTYKSIPHTHSYGADWKSDADNHWHECPCGDRKDTAAHSFKWVIDKEATATTRGSKHEECTVCGYKKAAVEIPATGSAAKPSDQPDNLGNTTSPKTGDSSNLVLWNALLFISGGAVIGTTVVSRKKKHNR
ncbi:MAG: InlB B-repeat-containing protein [Oscillospiraceae bacterium]